MSCQLLHSSQHPAAAFVTSAPRGNQQQLNPCCQRRRQLLVVKAAAAGRMPTSRNSDVAVKLTATSFSSRKLQASVAIHAPLPVVWEALTDYENLGTFIPSLAENRCLERRKQGCLLYQVGAQDVALGIKFSAACTLDIREYPEGIPPHMCTNKGDYGRYFPAPATPSSSSTGVAPPSRSNSRNSTPLSSMSSYSSMDSMSSFDEEAAAAAASTSGGHKTQRDISFNLVAGDFQAFKGIWRMQPGAAGDPTAASTVLQYALFVRPHPWLPVKLIEDRISSEVVNNLIAVRRHTERVHRQRQQQQQQQQLQQQQQQQQVANATAHGGGSSGGEAGGMAERSGSTFSSSTTADFSSSQE